MSNNAASRTQDPLKALLIKQGIERVAIVDDAFDSMAQRELTTEEANNLWGMLEFDDDFQRQIDDFGRQIGGADDLVGELIDELLANQSEVPRFVELWSRSIAGIRLTEALGSISGLRDQLRNSFNLEVGTFGSDTDPSTLVTYEPQLVFLDWYLGDDEVQPGGGGITDAGPHAVQVAVDTARGILENWPKESPTPLIILMSSKPGIETYAGEFCRRAQLLRGMFYAVPKTRLNDSLNLRVHLKLFAMSVPPGRRLQAFMDTLRGEFPVATRQLLETLSDLTLTDYAYIQRLCLQREGQPLGDYLIWLFSTYLGQLLFAEALKDARTDLDSMTFEQDLPSLGPPSDTLTDIYHTALFDTSVGPVVTHPLAFVQEASTPKGHPAIALGDLLRLRQWASADDNQNSAACRDNDCEADAEGSVGQVDSEVDAELLLVINAQCDLVYRPASGDITASEKDLTILLLPGTPRPVRNRGGSSKLSTELYQQDGVNYRIEWDTKNVRTISLSQFRKWTKSKGYERVARLRLPFALEIQRTFASDLTRVGSPVTPPIYQPIEALFAPSER